MANIRNGNTHYVDSTGTLSETKNVRVTGIVLTATTAGAVLVLKDPSTSALKIELRVAATNTSQYFAFRETPLYFPNGISVFTLTNAKATIVYNEAGGRA